MSNYYLNTAQVSKLKNRRKKNTDAKITVENKNHRYIIMLFTRSKLTGIFYLLKTGGGFDKNSDAWRDPPPKRRRLLLE